MRVNEQRRIEMNKKLRKEIQEVTAQVDKLNQDSAQFDREITALKVILTVSEKMLAECSKKNTKLQSQVDQLKSILTQDKADFEETKQEQETLQGKLSQSLSTVKTDILQQQEN